MKQLRSFCRLFLLVFIFSACSKNTTYINNPDAPDYLHNRPVGASARELLASDTYTSVKIEILYMPGYEPDGAALSHMQAYLNGLVNKPAGIIITTKEIPASTSNTLSVNDVIAIEQQNRTVFSSKDQLGVCIIYTNGKHTEANTLGVAYRNSSAVLFGKTIHDNSGNIGQASRTKLEATVLEHEFGHLLGLVGIGSPMQTPHKDGTNGHHCNDSNCLMYYASETTDILGFLLTGNIPSLDQHCRNDLRANGGR